MPRVRRLSRPTRHVPLALLAGALAAGGAGAQDTLSIRGTIRAAVATEPGADAGSAPAARPVAGARLLLRRAALPADPAPRAVTTDAAGRFAFAALPRGDYVLALRTLGYLPHEWSITLDGSLDGTLEAERVATVLPRVETRAAATAAARYLSAVGFDDRRQRGGGTFLRTDQLPRYSDRTLADALRPFLRGCMMVFVDGGRGSIGRLTVREAAGVEVYRTPTSAPAEFQAQRTCGSAVVWTRVPDGR